MKKGKNNLQKRFERSQQDSNEGLIKIILSIGICVGIVFWIFQDIQPMQHEFDELTEEYVVAEESDLYNDEVVEKYATIIEEPSEVIAEEEQTVDFYYNRALEKEKKKDFKGAVEDYEKTISMAKKYSREMSNSLNNGGVIKAQQFKDYKGALKDFNRIINIETNRYDGEINATRLESGYTNRAYVKKMKGDSEGACDDLYEALSLGIEGSQEFIEKQIDKICS